MPYKSAFSMSVSFSNWQRTRSANVHVLVNSPTLCTCYIDLSEIKGQFAIVTMDSNNLHLAGPCRTLQVFRIFHSPFPNAHPKGFRFAKGASFNACEAAPTYPLRTSRWSCSNLFGRCIQTALDGRTPAPHATQGDQRRQTAYGPKELNDLFGLRRVRLFKSESIEPKPHEHASALQFGQVLKLSQKKKADKS